MDALCQCCQSRAPSGLDDPVDAIDWSDGLLLNRSSWLRNNSMVRQPLSLSLSWSALMSWNSLSRPLLCFTVNGKLMKSSLCSVLSMASGSSPKEHSAVLSTEAFKSSKGVLGPWSFGTLCSFFHFIRRFCSRKRDDKQYVDQDDSIKMCIVVRKGSVSQKRKHSQPVPIRAASYRLPTVWYNMTKNLLFLRENKSSIVLFYGKVGNYWPQTLKDYFQSEVNGIAQQRYWLFCEEYGEERIPDRKFNKRWPPWAIYNWGGENRQGVTHRSGNNAWRRVNSSDSFLTWNHILICLSVSCKPCAISIRLRLVRYLKLKSQCITCEIYRVAVTKLDKWLFKRSSLSSVKQPKVGPSAYTKLIKKSCCSSIQR